MNKKIRVLITAGPTREYLDPVRYLSNDSSGQMGFALAKAAQEFGCEVTLIAGPVKLTTPPKVKRIDVVSGREMHKKTMQYAKRSDLIIMAAAVADWRPKKQNKEKIKKGSTVPSISLINNPDILAELCKKKNCQIIVGFALETSHLEQNARTKLAEKGCDWIVANNACAINANQSRAILLNSKGKKIYLPLLSKEDLAVIILSHVMC
jgi:phosphopantothenoylcysteine decarboxylase/phosphopantothenate--cysteine ligase